MDIKEFLKLHPLINCYSIDKALNLPVGTVRISRPIPERHIAAIQGLLSSYGYESGAIREKPAEVVRQTAGGYYTKKEGKLYSIKTDVMEKRWDGKMGLVTKDVNDIPDGSIVVVS